MILGFTTNRYQQHIWHCPNMIPQFMALFQGKLVGNHGIQVPYYAL